MISPRSSLYIIMYILYVCIIMYVSVWNFNTKFLEHLFAMIYFYNNCSWWLLHSRLGKDQVLFTKNPPKNKNCKSVLGRKILYIIQNKSDAILVLPFTVLISTPFCSGTLRAHCSLHWHSGLTARCRILKCFHGTLGWHRHNNTD